jgi:hypothetical protein
MRKKMRKRRKRRKNRYDIPIGISYYALLKHLFPSKDVIS